MHPLPTSLPISGTWITKNNGYGVYLHAIFKSELTF